MRFATSLFGLALFALVDALRLVNFQCNEISCHDGESVSIVDLRQRFVEAEKICVASGDLTAAQCGAALEFAWGMLPRAPGNRKCITDEIIVKLSKLFNVVSLKVEEKDRSGLVDPPKGTELASIFVEYEEELAPLDTWNRYKVAAQRLSERKKRSNPIARREILIREAHISRDEAWNDTQEEEHSEVDIRKSRRTNTVPRDYGNCVCPSSYPLTTWYGPCCTLLCSMGYNPLYNMDLMVSCCQNNIPNLGEYWNVFCWVSRFSYFSEGYLDCASFQLLTSSYGLSPTILDLGARSSMRRFFVFCVLNHYGNKKKTLRRKLRKLLRLFNCLYKIQLKWAQWPSAMEERAGLGEVSKSGRIRQTPRECLYPL